MQNMFQFFNYLPVYAPNIILIWIFVTKIQKTGRVWTNYTKKQKAKIKKRASSLEPLASCKKSLKAFLFLLTSNCYPKINLSFYP